MGGAVWVGLWHAVAALTGKLRYPRGQTGPRVRGSRSGCRSTVLLQDADHSASPASWPQEITEWLIPGSRRSVARLKFGAPHFRNVKLA